MSMFSVRIEIHNATWSQYDELHRLMAEQGFSRLVVADSGERYHLPIGMYNLVGHYTDQHVMNLAFAAASAIDPTCEVFVEQGASRLWRGLERVQPTLAELLASSQYPSANNSMTELGQLMMNDYLLASFNQQNQGGK